MLGLYLLVSTISCVLTKSFLPEALKAAIAESFLETADTVNINIETDFEYNEVVFSDAVEYILTQKWDFVLELNVNNHDTPSIGDHNIWLIDSVDAFRRLLPLIDVYWKDSQLFFFVVFKSVSIEESLDQIQKLFADFLKLMIANVNIILETTSNEVQFYTFYPYQEFDCRSPKPILFNQFKNNTFKYKTPFFPPKANNLHRCPIRVESRNDAFLPNQKKPPLELPKLEFCMFSEIAHRMNFKFATIIEPANKINEIRKHLLLENGTVDLKVGFYSNSLTSPEQGQFFSKSVEYFYTWVGIVLRRPPITFQRFTWLFISFDLSTWMCTLMLLTLTAGITVSARKSRRMVKIFNLSKCCSGVLDIIALAIGSPIQHLPKVHSLRFSFVVFCFGTLVIRAAYQGKLFDAYRRLVAIKSPLSLTQLLAENYTIYSHPIYIDSMIDFKGLDYNIKNLDSFKIGFNFLANSYDKNALVASYAFIYSAYTSKEVKDMIMEALFGEPYCIYFQPHSIIVPKFNEILMRMEEVGFLYRLRKNYDKMTNIVFSEKTNNIIPEPGPVVLGRLVFAFCLLGSLHLVAMFVFIAELYCGNRNFKNVPPKSILTKNSLNA